MSSFEESGERGRKGSLFSLSEWQVGWGNSQIMFSGLLGTSAFSVPSWKPARVGQACFLPLMAKIARRPFPTPRSVPGPSASTVAAPACPESQQWLPGGAKEGQLGAGVCGGAVQL